MNLRELATRVIRVGNTLATCAVWLAAHVRRRPATEETVDARGAYVGGDLDLARDRGPGLSYGMSM